MPLCREPTAALNGHPQNYHQTDVFDTGLDSPLLDVLNVRYVLVPAATAEDQLAPRFGRSLQAVYADENVRVLVRPTSDLEGECRIMAGGEVSSRPSTEWPGGNLGWRSSRRRSRR